MSHRATGWVLYDAPVKDATQVLILWALADRANDDGTAAWPAQQWIADRARCSTRTVRRHLADLEEQGIIRRGDQELVSHFRADSRPVVWDIVMVKRPDKLSGREQERPDTGGQSDRTTVSDNTSTTYSVSRTTQGAKRATALPDGFTITDQMRAWARDNTPLVDLDVKLGEWMDYWRGRGATMKDWEATWRNGMRKQQEFAVRDAQLHPVAKGDPNAWMNQ